jgi:hypothetical protein
MRNLLPQRRFCETFQLTHGKQNNAFAVTVGRYNDGTLGEVFISGAKAGSEMDAITRDSAILLSLAMQYGVDLDTIKHALTREPSGSPMTIVGAVVDKLR